MLVPTVLCARLRTFLTSSRLDREAAQEAMRRVQTIVGAQNGLRITNKLARFVRHVSGVLRPARYLEVGAHHGVSLVLVHTLLEGKVEATCVDPFCEHPEFPYANWSNTEAMFRKHADAIGGARLLKGRAIDELPKLLDAKEQFNLIFIDGSHRTLDVMLDAVLAWQLLPPGGLMIFDDYWYDAHFGEPYAPRRAIDAFIGMVRPQVLDVSGQVFVRR